ncbi:MAG: BatD family protein [Bacteroidota bacterium]
MKNYFLIAFSMVASCVLAQKSQVVLEVDPPNALPGEVITITVKANVEGEFDIELPNGFVQGYNIMSGMEQEMDYNTGKIQTIYYLTNTGVLPKEGKYTFGPAYVKRGSKVYQSNTVKITIKKEQESNDATNGEITKRQLKDPAFGVIETSKKTIYEGEAVVISARVYSHFNPSHLENYIGYNLSGVLDKHEIGNTQRILVDKTTVKGLQLYTFVYDKNVFFPTGTGNIKVEPYKVLLRNGYETVPLTSTSATVNVKPLPKAPQYFAGGVGSFGISQSIDKKQLKQGEVLTMLVTINGTGNLQNLMEPVLQLPKGFLLYGDALVKENFTYTSAGSNGSVSYEFHIQATKDGDFEIPATKYVYFDPRAEKYVTVSAQQLPLSVEKNPGFKPSHNIDVPKDQSPVAETTMMPVQNEEIIVNSINFIGNPVYWFGLSTPLGLALLLLFFNTKSLAAAPEKSAKLAFQKCCSKSADYLSAGDVAFHAGDYPSYYSNLEKALHEAMNSKLDLAGNTLLSKKEKLEQLRENGVEQSTITDISTIFEQIEMGRYGFDVNTHENLQAQASSIVNNLLKK